MRQDLINRFGADLDTDSVRVQDTSATRLSGGFGASIEGTRFSASAGATVTLVRSIVDLVDVNGDGLPDQVMKVPGEAFMRVKQNLGSFFSAEKRVALTGWGTLGLSIDPQGLLGFSLGSADTISFSTMDGFSGGAEAGVTFPVFGVPVTVSGGLSVDESDEALNLRLEDVDGDGSADHVLKLRGNTSVFARLNTGSKANLLRIVRRPLGGSFELDYRREGNRVDAARTPRVDMPQNIWALSSVKLNDGQDTVAQTVEYRYDVGGDGAFYDRRERESYGFSHVRTLRDDGSTLDRFFKNQTPSEQGLLAESIERQTADGPIVRRLVNTYQSRAVAPEARFEALVRRETFMAETFSSSTVAIVPSRVERFDYDAAGNVVFFADDGERASGSDDIEYTILFQQTELATSRNIFKPTFVECRARSTGQVLRRRTAHYRLDGAPDRITNLLSGGRQPTSGAPYIGADTTNPVWTFNYDAFGNLFTVTDPKGFQLVYGYDVPTSTYRTSVTEPSTGFGYQSQAAYDLRFGTQTEVVDVNGQRRRTLPDEFGRPSKIWGPNEIEGQVSAPAPTIEFRYQPAVRLPVTGRELFTPASALTRHKDAARDPSGGDTLDVTTFIDGLGRVIQTRKEMERDSGTGMTTTPGTSVSGRVLFDSRGRVFKQGQPIFDTSAITTFVAVGLQRETTFQYDTISRVRQVTTPDGAVTTTSYQLGTLDGQQRLLTLLRDPNGKIRRIFRSVRDEIAAVQETNVIRGVPTALTTRYLYDPLSQLVEVRDALGNVTTSAYDTLGQMVALASPDAGRTEWRFDVGGNVGAKETANLRAAGQLIRYQYDFNRLRLIEYPDTDPVTYTYGVADEQGDAGGNRAGRVKLETSEAGEKEMRYDRLGNVASERISLIDIFERPPVTQELQYLYDSFGRMLQMTYATWSPETIFYGYDQGGNLRSVRGRDATATRTYLRFVGYDEFEQRTRTVFGNDIETVYEYEPLTRRLSRVHADFRDVLMQQAGVPARPMQRLRYVYDLVGNVRELANEVPLPPVGGPSSSAADVGPTRHTFVYDDLYQLTSADGIYQNEPNVRFRQSLTFAYDEIGNITRKDQRSLEDAIQSNGTVVTAVRPDTTYTFDYLYQGPRPHGASAIDETLTGDVHNQRTFVYDADGNQQGWIFPPGQGTSRQVTWTAEDRLRSVREGGPEISSAIYDGSGARTYHLAGSDETLHFGPHLTFHNRDVGTKHLFAAGMRFASRVEVRAVPMPAATFYYHPDHLQSAQFVSSPQNLVEHHEYFASGELWIDETDPFLPLDPRFLFNGKEFDGETKLYNYGARYYDPRLSTWASPDPILASYMQGGASGGVFQAKNLSVYTYTWNNPVKLRDPDGRRVRVVDDAPTSVDQRYTPEQNRRMVADYVGQVSGSEVSIDKRGYIQLGNQMKEGKEWDEARSRIQALIDDKREIGITGNRQTLGGWGFTRRGDITDGSLAMWAKSNRLDAFITISKDGSQNPYSYSNPAYRGFFRELFTDTPRYLQGPFTVGDHFAHEALGHAFAWISGGDVASESFARQAEDLFRAAEGRPLRSR